MPDNEPRLRLHFLDGLRGVASFYVLVFHAMGVKISDTSRLPVPLRWLGSVFGRGHYGVVVFIVLSGFSLMLPMARAASTELNGGFVGYMRRRARRIMPPYYAALALSIAVLAGYNVLGPRLGLGTKVEPEALSFGSIVSHLLLVHNVLFDWAFRINGPMWSVATEWQIYFVFALVLLPLLRRTNIVVVVVVACVLGSLPQLLLPDAHNGFWAGPWLLGSFALGMLGAHIGFAPSMRESWWRMRVPWGALAVVGLAGVVAMIVSGGADSWPGPLSDGVVSVFALFVVNACWSSSVRERSERLGAALARAFGSRRLVYLGGFSYSLYLVQHPVLRLTEKAFDKAGFSRAVTVVGHLLLVVPLIVAIAWVFAELFERPFTSGGVLLPALRRRFGRAAVPVGSAGLAAAGAVERAE